MVRRVIVVLALGAAALVLFPVAGVLAQSGGGTGVSADRDGWWSQGNVELSTPQGPVAPPIPQSPAVPDGSLPVSAVLGQSQTVAAVGIVIPDGMVANRLVMTLALAPGGGSETNATSAKIVACPITSPWGESQNGKFQDAPVADCGQASAPGTRKDDGSWTFDLTSIAALWADPFGTVRPDGVLLAEDVDPPGTFQVAFAGLPDGISFDADLAKAPASGGDSAFTSGGSSLGSGSALGGGSVDAGPLPVPSVGTGGAAAAKPRAAASRVARPTGHDAGHVWGNLPIGAILLVPLALLLAVVAGQSLGGGRQRTERVRRQGGVGRVLANRQPVRRSASELQ